MRFGVDAREIQDGIVTGIGRSLANFISYFAGHDSPMSWSCSLRRNSRYPSCLGAGR